jgi:hypothetical protein
MNGSRPLFFVLLDKDFCLAVMFCYWFVPAD